MDALIGAIKHNAGIPLSLLPQTDLVLPLARLRMPCVYAWIRADAVLYMGSSAGGAARGLDPFHHVIDATEPIQPADELRIIPCTTEREARALEQDLIQQLNPQLNQHLRSA